MEPINVKSSTYFDFGVENSDKNTKFKGHPVKISKYNFFFFLQNVIKKFGQKKFLLLKKVKHFVPWTYLIEDFNGE